MSNVYLPQITSDKRLKPCPFCGGKAMLVSDIRDNCVRCMKCGASGGCVHYSKSEAIEMWNKREKCNE